MPVNLSLRRAMVFSTFASLVYVLFRIRDIHNSRQQISSPWDAPASDNRITRSTRIVAVGDLHGDIENAQKVLEMARVVNSDGRWSGEVDIFVQTGDIIDRCVFRYRHTLRVSSLTHGPRGDDTIRLFDWMEDLRSQALGAGGRMLSHLGNHEWMNAIGQYVVQGISPC
jgi:Calcineurin-like phosphoesterase